MEVLPKGHAVAEHGRIPEAFCFSRDELLAGSLEHAEELSSLAKSGFALGPSSFSQCSNHFIQTEWSTQARFDFRADRFLTYAVTAYQTLHSS